MLRNFIIPGGSIGDVFDFDDKITFRRDARLVVRDLMHEQLQVERCHFKSQPYIQKRQGQATMGFRCQHQVNFIVLIPLTGLGDGIDSRAGVKPTVVNRSCLICCKF